MDMLYKSCRFFHTESNIIGFAFFWIFYKFLCISQVSVTLLILFKISFTPRSLGTFDSLQMCPWFAQKTLEILSGLQCGPWGMAGGGFGQIPVRSAPGRVGDGWRKVKGLRWADLWPEVGGQGAGEWARWCSAPAASAVIIPVGRPVVLAHTWLLGLEGDLVGVLEWFGCQGGERKEGLGSAAMTPARELGCARGGGTTP
jgi:hypothetical protein